MKKYSLLVIPAVIILSSIPISPAMSDFFNRPDFFEKGRREFENEIRRFEQREGRTPNSSLKLNPTSLPWTRVFIEKAGFTLLMPPGATTHETKTVADSKGNINFDIIATHPPSSRYVIAYSEEVTPARFQDSQEVLKKSRDEIISNNVGLRKVADKDITFNRQYPGKQFKLQNKNETIVFRLLLIRQRLYVLAVSQQTPDALSTKSINTFFESFQLTK